MKFSDYLWQKIQPIYQDIIRHPFNIELANGSLSQERFNFYIQQDACFLVDFSRALAFIAGRATEVNLIHQFLNFSLGALIAERELHSLFLASNLMNGNFELSPACKIYTKYLISMTATASLEESLAAVLPCFWIYREAGREIAKNARNNNPYILWINTYSSKEFSDSTDQVISIIDQMAAHCSQKLLKAMEQIFEHCSLLEWHFWDDAYLMRRFQ